MLYDTLVFVHVLAAIVWVGGGIASQVVTARLAKADPAHRLGAARDFLFIGTRIYPWASLIVLITGVSMVLDEAVLDFEQAWIVIGLIGLVATAGIGSGYITPQSRKAIAAVEAGNPAAAAPIGARIALASRTAAVLLLVALWAMVFKPGL
ncbi:MAG: DUF2269 family protein [Acidimicrobiia bacterium]|nr:MAG: DUF2269 family protein [Acidimicrobiia bacterium]